MERTPESEAVLNVEVEWSELEKASDRAYRKLVQKYNVPGFRRGHAPRAMLERMLGKDALYEEGLEDIVEESVRSAVREHHLRPLARASVDTPPIEHGQPYAFTARLPILSPVELGDYKSIHLERPDVEVTDEDVQRVVEDIRQDHTQWLPAERPAQIGDRVTVDLKVTAGERTISDLHDNDFELASERHGIYSGMDEQIVGMEVDQSKEFTTTIPEDYANTELAGKEAQFAVTLKAVKYRELPAIDDELALSLGYETLDAMRQAVREQLLERKRNQAERELRDNVADAVAEQAKVDIHPVLVDDEVHAMMREMERTLTQTRLSLERYLQLTNKTEQQLHEDLEPEARQRVRRNLVLSAVADAEDVDVTDQELEKWLEDLSAAGDGRPMRLRQLNPDQRESVRSRLRREKAWDRLVQMATEAQVTPSGEAPSVRNAQAAAAAPVAEAPVAEAPVAEAPEAATSTKINGSETTQPRAERAASPATTSAAKAPAAEQPRATEPAAAAQPAAAASSAGVESAETSAKSGVRVDSAEAGAAPAAGSASSKSGPVPAQASAPASKSGAAPKETGAAAPTRMDTRTDTKTDARPAGASAAQKERTPNTEVPDSPK